MGAVGSVVVVVDAPVLDEHLGFEEVVELPAVEELVAELGSAFLCSSLGITPEVREDHAAYLDHWLKVLKADRKAIFTAAAHAQRAVDYLHGVRQQNAVAA